MVSVSSKDGNGYQFGCVATACRCSGSLGVLPARQVNFKAAILIALSLMLGAWIGARGVSQLDSRVMKSLFGVFLIVLGCYVLGWPALKLRMLEQCLLKLAIPRL
jgi:uncharacterized membrane protein HdeD (DUF308 family)